MLVADYVPQYKLCDLHLPPSPSSRNKGKGESCESWKIYDRPTQITLLELIFTCRFSEIQTCKFYKLSSYNNETS